MNNLQSGNAGASAQSGADGGPDGQPDSGPASVPNETAAEPAAASAEGASAESDKPRELGGRDGPDPTRFGDWEKAGRCIDF
ncbi:MAG: DUF1674 domain-containing protein [Pseudomonadota bacterium]